MPESRRSDQRHDLGGKRRCKGHRFTCARVTEYQTRAVQRHPANRIAPVAVGGIAHDWKVLLRQVHPDLVLASRFEPDLNQGPVRRAFENLHMRHRPFAFRGIPRGVAPKCRILRKKRLDRELVAGDAALGDGDVRTPRRVVFELLLQGDLGLRQLGEHQEAGRLTIQPVNDEQPSRSLLPHVLEEQGIGRTVPFLFRGNGQQPRRLDDDDNIAILEQDLDIIAGDVAATRN